MKVDGFGGAFRIRRKGGSEAMYKSKSVTSSQIAERWYGGCEKPPFSKWE